MNHMDIAEKVSHVFFLKEIPLKSSRPTVLSVKLDQFVGFRMTVTLSEENSSIFFWGGIKKTHIGNPFSLGKMADTLCLRRGVKAISGA